MVLNSVGYLWLFIKCFPVYLSCLFVALIVLWVGYWLCFFWLFMVMFDLFDFGVRRGGVGWWFVALYFYVAFVVVFCCGLVVCLFSFR